MIEWVYSGPAKHHMFQPTFTKELHSAVENNKSLYLVPKDPNFPAFDSVVYDPRPGHGITDIQITTRMDHLVAVIDLKQVQGWLK